jgi:calcineurin-like phosphoesterase family protein
MKFKKMFVLKYKNYRFLLTHTPEDIPIDWKDWAICGHHHNSDLERFPFIDKKNKRINISTELTNYTPIEINELISKIESS